MAKIVKLTEEEFNQKSAKLKEMLGRDKADSEGKFIAKLKPGDIYYRDGTVYLGFYGGEDWFVMPKDAMDSEGKRLSSTFNEAVEYTTKLETHGHKDWRLPPGDRDKEEPNILGKMYEYRHTGAFDGTYDESGSEAFSSYWSSTPYITRVCNTRQDFSTGEVGEKHSAAKDNTCSFRCVRSQKRDW